MWKIARKYSFFQSTIFKIMSVIIILVLPVNILTVVFSTMIVENSQEQVSQEIQNGLDLAMANLEDSLNNGMKRLTYLGISDTDFLVTASADQKVNKGFQFHTSFQNAKDTLQDLKQVYDLIDLMYFFFPDTGYVITSGYPGISYQGYRDFIQTAPQREQSERRDWEYYDIEGVSTLISYDSWKNVYYGVVLNLNRTLDRLNLSNEMQGRTLFFTNKDGTLLTSEGMAYIESEGMSMEEIIQSSNYRVFQTELESYDLVLVEIIEREVMTEQFPALLKIMQYLSVALALIVVPLLLYYMSCVVSKPLNRLVRAIEKIEKGDLEYRIREGNQGGEFEKINHSFNSMMDQVRDLKIDVYENELEKKDIKMQYLSQQIQPHFILNAMNLIYSYEPEEYPLIQKMVLCISKYFRYIVNMNAEFVELSQEMNHIKNYFEIQRARYPDLFYSIVEYEESLGKVLIPPLIVQNFAENSIKHSLKIGNRITILVIADYNYVEGEPDRMSIRLADTGEGISDDLIEKIEIFKKTGIHQEGLGVGIQNVIERLKYLYDDKSTVRIWRDEVYEGTNVEIVLPIYYDKMKGDDKT